MEKINFFNSLVKYIRKVNKFSAVEKNIQEIYNKYGYEWIMNKEPNFWIQLDEYNSLYLDSPYLMSGQNGYFNEQVDKNGFNGFKVEEQDTEDAKFISNSFGVETNYQKSGIPIIYTTLGINTMLNYALQSFPTGIFENVFQCSVDHTLPIQPKVGETEEDFYLRLLKHQIDTFPSFNKDNENEVLLRGKRLINNFCKNKNRVYLIKISDVLDMKASFGDGLNLRECKSKEDALKELDSLYSLKDLMNVFSINFDNMLYNLNMTGEYGIALYGNIPKSKIKYIEVDRKYHMMQRKAIEMGMSVGEEIPSNFYEKYSK